MKAVTLGFVAASALVGLSGAAAPAFAAGNGLSQEAQLSLAAKAEYTQYRGRRYYGRRRGNAGAAAALGVAGAVIGGAIAADQYRRYNRGYYGGPAYGYAPGYGYARPAYGYGYYGY